jgi:3-O-methylgallate 3,4-dioxygenase
MAQLVLGIGTSHSPQLSVSWDGWAMRGEADKGNPALIGTDGIVSGYDELLARADVKRIAREITDDKFKQRFEENQRAIAQIAEVLGKASLDVLVMVGDDQHEYLLDDNMPGVCIYWGDQVLVKQGPPPIPRNGNRPLIGYSGQDRVAPTSPALGRHLIERLVENEFDVARSNRLDPQRGRSEGGIGHAFGFVYHRLMGDRLIPTVPIMVNTYYPPNQPTPKRCYDLGRAIRAAIEAWPVDARVGVLASGGLSHFVVDEELDTMALEGIKARDVAKLSRLPRERMNSGNSEIRNWIVATGATEHLAMKWSTYVPCYRSPAGTGCAMAFAEWS